MANLVPEVGGIEMFLPEGDSGSTEDNSIESAIKFTIPSGVRPSRITNFGSLISHVPDYNLIHNNHGTKGSVPNGQGQFRGYPKPTFSLQFEVVTVGTFPSETYQKLMCKPVMNNMVGFALTVTISVIENDPTDGIDEHDETFTFNKGSTTPDSSSLTPDGDGRYRLDTTYPQPTNVEDLGMIVDSYTAGEDAYFVDEIGGIEISTFSTSLTYVGATTVYSKIFHFTYDNGTACGGTVPPIDGNLTLYTVTVPCVSSCGNTDPTWPSGGQFFKEAELLNVADNDSYATTDTSWVWYDVYTISDGSGNATRNQHDCT